MVSSIMECARTGDEVRFDISMEPLPEQFEGMRWRSYIRKISDSQVAVGLEVAKKGEELKSYGETILTKTK